MDRHGVRPDPEAVEAVFTWKAPRTDTQLMSFLRFANYYREFIKGYADKVYPMQKLMHNKGKKFEWNDEAEIAFENIKRELCEAYRKGHRRIGSSHLRNFASGARMERKNSSPFHCIRQQGLE